MAYLEYFVKGLRQEFKLKRADTTIGRATTCSLQLTDDAELSRIHCSIQRQADKTFAVLDADSCNGTFLNGQRLTEQGVPLKDGDVIAIGRTALTFRDQDIGAATAMFLEVDEQIQEGRGYRELLQDIVKKKRPKGK